jgi:hypothetical protein
VVELIIIGQQFAVEMRYKVWCCCHFRYTLYPILKFDEFERLKIIHNVMILKNDPKIVAPQS